MSIRAKRAPLPAGRVPRRAPLHLVVLAVLSAALSTGAAAPQAKAGEYHVYGCRTPTGAATTTDGWRQSAAFPLGGFFRAAHLPDPKVVTDPAWTGWVSSCASGGSLGIVVSPATATAGEHFAGVRFEPGGDLKIVRGVISRAFSTTGGGVAELSYPGATPEVTQGGTTTFRPRDPIDYVTGTANAGNLASPTSPSNRVDFPTADSQGRFTPPSPLNTLDLIASCWAYPGTPSPCGTAVAHLFRSDLVLRDSTAPEVTLTGGTFLERSTLTSRPLTGAESVTVAASDGGIGVARLAVELDGVETHSAQLRDAQGAACALSPHPDDGLPASPAVRPCPRAGSATVVIDTRTVADGRHRLRVLVSDGAGETSVVAQGSVLVRNTELVGPGSPDEFRGAANGATTSDQGVVTAGWRATARAPSAKPSIRRRCQNAQYRKQHKLACDGRAAATTITRTWSSRATELTGRLTDAAGSPISGATLDVAAAHDGRPTTRRSSVTTGGDGSYSAKIPLADGNQTVTVTWRARVGDTVLAASSQATLRVGVRTSFAASGLVAGSRARFSGRIAASALIDDTTRVRVQWKSVVTGRWNTFETVRPDKQGRWVVRRRLSLADQVYRMQAVVERSPSGRFVSGAGTQRTVRVR